SADSERWRLMAAEAFWSGYNFAGGIEAFPMPFHSPHLSRLARFCLVLGFAQAAHSMEEMAAHLYDFFWVVTGIIHSHFASFAQFRMDPVLFAVLNMGLITLLLGTVPFVELRRRWALMIAAVAGVIETLNGINHLAAVAYFRGYAPGAFTAPLLLVLAVLVLRELWKSRAPT